MIKLRKQKTGLLKSFPFGVAEKILRDRETKYAKVEFYWELPSDSKYVFEDGSLIKKKVEPKE